MQDIAELPLVPDNYASADGIYSIGAFVARFGRDADPGRVRAAMSERVGSLAQTDDVVGSLSNWGSFRAPTYDCAEEIYLRTTDDAAANGIFANNREKVNTFRRSWINTWASDAQDAGFLPKQWQLKLLPKDDGAYTLEITGENLGKLAERVYLLRARKMYCNVLPIGDICRDDT